MDRATVDVYEHRADEWAARRSALHRSRAVGLAERALPRLPVADLGCGPGNYLGDLGPAVVGIDAAGAMLALAAGAAATLNQRPPALVRADIEALPVRDRGLGGAWASNSYLHVARDRLPLALARLHWALAVGSPVTLSVLPGDGEGPWPGDEFPGRSFTYWQPEALDSVLVGAGFDVESVSVEGDRLWATARRARTLPDTVTSGLRVLVCGLNPSVYSADAGYPFARPRNRFWPAALASGLVTRARDPLACAVDDRVGLTDMVKRATPNAAALGPEEFRAGAERVRRLVGWLQPELVLFVGLAGWRAAVDRRAVAGLQPGGFGGVAAYLMPSTSGLNASSKPADLAAHMAQALASAGPA